MKTDVDVYKLRSPILYWSLDNGTVMLVNGDHFPITAWFDETGEQTDDGLDVVAVAAGPDRNGKHWSIDATVIPWVPIQ